MLIDVKEYSDYHLLDQARRRLKEVHALTGEPLFHA